MKQLSREQLKNLVGGTMPTGKTCTLDCTDSEGFMYGTDLGTACTKDSDCSSTSTCESGYTKSYHCS